MANPLLKLIGSKRHPRGPGFGRARPHHLELSGTHIHFKPPPNSDHKVPFDPMPEKYNLYDEKLFHVDPVRENSLPTATLYTEGWSYYGLPLFQGEIGCLTMAIFVVHTPRHGNLFHADNFIRALDEEVLEQYGPGSHPSITYLNWASKNIHGNDWVRFNTQQIDDLHNYADWVLPISESHLLFFAFPHYVHKPGTRLNEAYREMEDRIMATVRIDWSPDSLRQKQEAQSQDPDARLPEQREPWEWPASEWEKYRVKSEMEELQELAERLGREAEAEQDEREKRRQAG